MRNDLQASRSLVIGFVVAVSFIILSIGAIPGVEATPVDPAGEHPFTAATAVDIELPQWTEAGPVATVNAYGDCSEFPAYCGYVWDPSEECCRATLVPCFKTCY